MATVQPTKHSPLTTKGDLLTVDASGNAYRLAVGTDGKVLKASAAADGGVAWDTAAAGDVIGPATNTDTYVPRWNGTDSKTLSDGLAVGTAANNLVQLDSSAALPAVDGSNLTGITGGIKGNSIGLKRMSTTAGFVTNNLVIHLSASTWLKLDGTDIFRTTNSGGAWSDVGDYAETAGQIRAYVNPLDANYVVVFSDVGVAPQYSDDAGATWTAVTLPADVTANVACSITDTGRIYVIYCSTDGGGPTKVAYTENDGTSWTSVTGFTSLANSDNFRCLSPTNGVVLTGQHDTGADDSRASYTLDGGSNWVEMSSTSGSGLDKFMCIYLDADNYFINATLDADPHEGLYVIKWKGTTLLSSATVSFIYEPNLNTVRRILRFDENDFVYTVFATSSRYAATVRYDASGYLYVSALPFPYQDFEDASELNVPCDIGCYYDGKSLTAGEHRVLTEPLGDINNNNGANYALWDIWMT